MKALNTTRRDVWSILSRGVAFCGWMLVGVICGTGMLALFSTLLLLVVQYAAVEGLVSPPTSLGPTFNGITGDPLIR